MTDPLGVLDSVVVPRCELGLVVGYDFGLSALSGWMGGHPGGQGGFGGCGRWFFLGKLLLRGVGLDCGAVLGGVCMG